MSKKRPSVVVTRRLPSVVETRLRELFDAKLNSEDQPMSREELAAAMASADVLVPTVTDDIDAELIGVSSRLSVASNNSRMRVSIESGNLRVTTTRGFFLTVMSCSHEAV